MTERSPKEDEEIICLQSLGLVGSDSDLPAGLQGAWILFGMKMNDGVLAYLYHLLFMRFTLQVSRVTL